MPAKRTALTQIDYWDAVWEHASLPARLETDRYLGWRLDRWLARHLEGRRGQTILEVGCAPGASLVYFHERWGMAPTGVDFSPVGVAATKRNFELTNTPGRVIAADFFDAPSEQFDVVWSAGVVEHFENLAVPMQRLWNLTKPGGLLLTEVPNFVSPLYAGAQRLVGPEILAHHRRIRPEDLRRACKQLGGEQIEARYLGTWNLMILNFTDRPRWEAPIRLVNAAIMRVLRRGRVTRPESRLLSPYIVAACRRPALQPP